MIMKKLMLLIGFTFITVYMNGQSHPSNDGSLELAKAGDFVLDVNDFIYAKSALEFYHLPIDDEATEAAAEFGEIVGRREYLEGVTTHAILKKQQTTNNKQESLFSGVIDAKPSPLLHKTIKRLYFYMGKIHQEKFIQDLVSLGYNKVKTENVEIDLLGVRPQTTYQNGNKVCKVVYTKDGSALIAEFERSKEIMSKEEEDLAHECRFCLSLGVNNESPLVIDADNLQPAEVDLTFPNENTIISIPYDVLEGKDLELEKMHRSGTIMGWELFDGSVIERRTPVRTLKQFIIKSDGDLDVDLQKIPNLSSLSNKRLRAKFKMENALAEWLAPNITISKPATIYFPRFDKKYRVNSALTFEIHESKEDLDTCRIHLNIKRKGYYGNYEYTIKNIKEIMTTLSKLYKNEDVLSSLIESLKRKMDYNNVIGNKFDIDVYAYRHNVTFKYKDRNVTYKLPLIFEWGNPQE